MKLAKGGTKRNIPFFYFFLFFFFFGYTLNKAEQTNVSFGWEDFKPDFGKSESQRRAVKFLREKQGFY